MKKIISLLILAVFLTTGCDKNSPSTENQLQNNQVYFFFYNGCQYCHQALDYINTRYPDLKLSMTNISNPEGYNLFIKCARKFKLGQNIGTPLFCMGENYLMGWSPQSEALFDEYVKPYL